MFQLLFQLKYNILLIINKLLYTQHNSNRYKHRNDRYKSYLCDRSIWCIPILHQNEYLHRKHGYFQRRLREFIF